MSYESIFSLYEGTQNEIDRLLNYMIKFGASDIHLKAHSSPYLRIGKQMRSLDMAPFSPEQAENLIFEIMNEHQRKSYIETGDADFSYMIPEGQRFRMNVYRERGTIALAGRMISSEIPTFESLGLPRKTFEKISHFDSGMVLLSGLTGSGKSTTIAAIIDHINTHRRCHVITVEDPIEYLYRDKKACINQREVGKDVKDFNHAIRTLVRQDPDVIVVGEMRDPETFGFGLMAAETGHLVFGTLHAATTSHVIPRILDLFPSDQHNQIRQSLSFNLQAVVCQRLLPCLQKSTPVIPALEILITNGTVKKFLQEGKDEKLIDVVRASTQEDMIDFNGSLHKLLEKGLIAEDIAMANSPNPEALQMLMQGIDLRQDGIVT